MVFFNLRPNNRLSKQWWGWPGDLRRQHAHYDVIVMTRPVHALYFLGYTVSHFDYVNIGSGNGLSFHGTKPLPEPMCKRWNSPIILNNIINFHFSPQEIWRRLWAPSLHRHVSLTTITGTFFHWNPLVEWLPPASQDEQQSHFKAQRQIYRKKYCVVAIHTTHVCGPFTGNTIAATHGFCINANQISHVTIFKSTLTLRN